MPPTIRYAGFGEESTYGVAVPAAFHVDVASAALDSPTETENYYAGGLGRGIRTRRPGYYQPGGNIVYAFGIRTIASMLRWALGGYVFEEGSAPGLNQHEIFSVNEAILPSFTTRVGKDVFEHVFAGCSVDSLELNLAGDFLLATMALGARQDTRADLEAIDDLLLPDEFPFAFHEVELELPLATDLSAKVKALTLTIANGQRPESGRGINSRFPYRMPAGERSVSFACDLWYENLEHLDAFWGDANGPSDDGAADFEAQIVADAGDDGSLTLYLPSAHFSTVSQPASGRNEITQSTKITTMIADAALADASTVETEILATVLNGADDLAGSS